MDNQQPSSLNGKGSTTIPEGSTSEANADGNSVCPEKDKDIV